MFQKKLYVTIPQWFEPFSNMSDLWPGQNRAKCGLQLNDPIDWLKLRLSQPKIQKHFGHIKLYKNFEKSKSNNHNKLVTLITAQYYDPFGLKQQSSMQDHEAIAEKYVEYICSPLIRFLQILIVNIHIHITVWVKTLDLNPSRETSIHILMLSF